MKAAALHKQHASSASSSGNVSGSRGAALRSCRRRARVVHLSAQAGGGPNASWGPDKFTAWRSSLEMAYSKEGAQELTGRPAGSATVTVSFAAPPIDWSRYHIQLLFVDRTDTLRARVAAGIFDRIAEWNGFGRAMYTWTSGLDAVPPPHPNHPLSPQHPHQHQQHPSEHPQLQQKPLRTGLGMGGGIPPTSSSSSSSSASTLSSSSSAGVPAGVRDASRLAAVVSAAAALKLSPREMSRPQERFEVEDLDRYDLILCLDRTIRQSILDQVPLEYKAYYEDKVCLLTSFSRYECDATVLAGGGFALLPMQLSFLLRTAQDAAVVKGLEDIHSPQLSGSSSVAEWDTMVKSVVWATAGLAKYLMDAMPDDSMDPQDA